MKNNSLVWLQAWFASQCKEIGTEGHGIIIQSLEKPGWQIKINLQPTPLRSKQFKDLSITRTHHDWLECTVQNECFHAHCGLHNLIEVIEIFRVWAQSRSPKIWTQKFTVEKTTNFKMLSLFVFREESKR